jgi:hypothetical protein
LLVETGVSNVSRLLPGAKLFVITADGNDDDDDDDDDDDFGAGVICSM